MSEYQCSEERFLKDVENHQLGIIRDDGVHRHLRFKNPKSGTYWFDLITWDGRLCISGDCGTYVFARSPDMFSFFGDGNKYIEPLEINPQYWAQKIEATERNGGHKEWSFKKFKECVKDDVDAVYGGLKDDENKRVTEKLWQDLERDVFSVADNEFTALQAIDNFENDDFEFDAFFDHDCNDWTHGYVWCCYAIVWGIRQYEKDKSK